PRLVTSSPERRKTILPRKSRRILALARKSHPHDFTKSQKVLPVRRVSASRYLARVRSTTSGGSSGGGLFLSQPVVSSQSRTNCLSNDGGLAPGRYEARGQKRELSGVSTSSINRISPPGSRPHSNLVSAIRMPRPAA